MLTHRRGTAGQGSEEAVRALLDALKVDSPSVRDAAWESLSQNVATREAA